MDCTFRITANCVDLVAGKIMPATVHVVDGVIEVIEPVSQADGFLLPGFVDSHVHIESSMLLPSTFAATAVTHGTVATVSDPHEIANVCGIDGVKLMLRDAARTPMKIHFGAPSCVPATPFETAGATLDLEAVESLLNDSRINHLAEMMNYPGVIAGNPEVIAKIEAAQRRQLPVDGHAPGLRGNEVARYLNRGISTDHECVTLDEAIEKTEAGCQIAIREGSAARNFEALWPLIDQFPDACFFCSDDKHPDELLVGHINELVAKALRRGCDLMNTLRVASLNPIRHYDLPVGLLQRGDPADFILTQDLTEFAIRACFIDGVQVSDHGRSLLAVSCPETINNFNATPIPSNSLQLPAESTSIRVIEVTDGQITTQASVRPAAIREGLAVSDTATDTLKLVVVNRYQNAQPAVGFASGFGLRRGALASSVAHDSHNVVAVGVDDVDIVAAVNAVIEAKGGLSVAFDGYVDLLPLPVAGLMSPSSCADVADAYARLNNWLQAAGSTLAAPFMTASFLPLLVIPSLKLSDKGLFDVDRFEFVSVFAK